MLSEVISLITLVLGAFASTTHGHAIVGLEARDNGKSSEDSAPKLGAVASESAVCSRVGTDLLEHGGNAADAVRSLIWDRARSRKGLRRLMGWIASWHAVLRWCHR